jgi:hypothetical protein
VVAACNAGGPACRSTTRSKMSRMRSRSAFKPEKLAPCSRAEWSSVPAP